MPSLRRAGPRRWPDIRHVSRATNPPGVGGPTRTPTLRKLNHDPNSRFLVLHAESEMAPLIRQHRFANFKPKMAIKAVKTSSTRYRRSGHPGTRLIETSPRESIARCSTWVIGDPLRRLRVNFQGQELGQKSETSISTRLLAPWYGARRAPDLRAIRKSHVDGRRDQVGRPGNCDRPRRPEGNDSLASAPKNFRGRSRGNKSPFLEAASGFEPEYGALQAPA